MAYASTNPPRLVGQTMNGPRTWQYISADAGSAVDASGYFTDGYALGMRDGDRLQVYTTGTKVWTNHTVTVSGTTVNVADGTTVGSGTNTD